MNSSAGRGCLDVFLIFFFHMILLNISMKNIIKESSKLEVSVHDSNVIPLTHTYDLCGPGTKTFANDLKPPHAPCTVPLPSEGCEL